MNKKLRGLMGPTPKKEPNSKNIGTGKVPATKTKKPTTKKY